MTDRHAGYIIALDHEIREDDAEATIAAIKQIKGVIGVTPVIADVNYAIAKECVYRELSNKLLDIVRGLNSV